jgi:hypothetical protein
MPFLNPRNIPVEELEGFGVAQTRRQLSRDLARRERCKCNWFQQRPDDPKSRYVGARGPKYLLRKFKCQRGAFTHAQKR